MRHADAVGSAAVVTDQNGVKLDDCDYLPFGQTNCITSSSGNDYLYTGLERDADQLDHTLHRQYSSSFGRWMSPDPGGVKVVNMDTPQTWNMYAYVADNPTTDTDPTGLSSQYNTNGGCATLRNCTDDRQSLDHPPNQELPSGTNTNQANLLTATVQGTQVTVTAQQHKATVIFGETSGLRSEVGKNGKPITTPGADPNLKTARENVADVSARNGRVYSRTPSAAELKNPQVRAAWQASQAAAAGSNGSLPGNNFFIRQAGVGPQRPSARAGWGQGKPVREYGPFTNVGGGDVPKGPRTYIDIY